MCLSVCMQEVKRLRDIGAWGFGGERTLPEHAITQSVIAIHTHTDSSITTESGNTFSESTYNVQASNLLCSHPH